MMIDFAGIKKDYLTHQKKIHFAIQRVLDSACFIMGDEVKKLEENLKNYVGSKYALTCSNGTSALILSLMALGIQKDDEIITSSFSFFASAEAIAILGAKPIFVDINPKTFLIDETKIKQAITKKTKAILVVSLFGNIPNMEKINSIAKEFGLFVLEDGAQSFGAMYQGKKSGNLCDISTTSFFPAKPLGCFGDGGAIFFNDENLYEKIYALRSHGQIKRYTHEYLGINARLDSLQAAILNVKLSYFSEILQKRQENAQKYQEKLKDYPEIFLQEITKDCKSNYAQFSILSKNRDSLIAYLKTKQIPTAIHYPIPIPKQKAFSYLNVEKKYFSQAQKITQEIFSLPLHAYLSDEEITYITQCIKEFKGI
ncbi:DegT/DnrJ/EryC1/StrS family aminotransferase [Helicobacter anatolicus]|uniref:DegT/DnrJ/EryC1/StrS family aminotransferase n=1 Tax=Helicobacter anatolicus TaxID=2905874 RepID=UPI001E5C3BD5|nr:DegT/DnrJ/EryC1/StrS family aminotransferase [Helicobacter anatolicus]MCE3038193.1 DegT/DnrJ/EryC1/StrS family aminotransferase [Helicobacter anatolicus]